MRSFDHLVGPRKQHLRNFDAKRPGDFQVHDQIKPGWLFDRQMGGPRAPRKSLTTWRPIVSANRRRRGAR